MALPNGARLLKALGAGLFDPQQAGQITRLCPVRTICRLVGHANGGPAQGPTG